jgi:hypothetical protein
MATTYLTRTPSSGAATQKATFSFWVKKTNITGTPNLFRMYTNSTQYVRIRFESSNKISFIIINSDSYVVQLISTQVFRDTSAWYNIVCNMDTTQATASDRAKIYINGERITAYDTAVYPPTQDANIIVTPSGTANVIGTQIGDSASYFEGCMSHINFTDGYVYQASEFGETDSTTGEWKIKTSPSVTYGTNGFFILKDGNSVTDQSGEGNNFAVTAGTLTNTEDCPSNVFAIMNRESPTTVALASMANGNLYNGDQSPNYWQGIPGTLAASSGKIYWEVKIEGVWGSTSQNTQRHGIADIGAAVDNNTSDAYDIQWTTAAYGIGWCNTSGVRNSGSVTGTSDYSTFIATNVLMFAMDLDNLKLYLGKNGAWENSGDPTSGASGTGAYTIPTAGMWAPYSETKYGSDVISWNCGNGYFRTVAISPAGSPASTPGIFQYQIPTGYQHISTKGLNL